MSSTDEDQKLGFSRKSIGLAHNSQGTFYKSTALLDEEEGEIPEKKPKYPRSVFFIVTNEFCERFSYYGMRTILSLYLRNILRYDDDTATTIYHTFTMLCYFFPLFGAMLADSLLGKFRTILYLSFVYAAGNIVISLASANDSIPGMPAREISILGLVLIAIGTGGIKPCVSSFGGDQFVLPQQEKQLAQFFSLFYFAINSGSLVSTFITPILREDVPCLGQTSCYPLAFGVPAALMIVSIIVFLVGKSLYVIKKPEGNVVLKVSKCITHALSQKIKAKGEKRDHWLDYADDKHDKNLIEDIKATLRVMFLYIPLPIFWALFDQQGSRWTFQATRMTGELGSWSLKPDQMQVVNPVLILVFIPVFEAGIYPLFEKCNLLKKPLQRIGVGGVLAAISFIISAIVELQLEPTYAVLPKSGEAQLRIFNGLDTQLNVSLDNNLNNVIEALGVWELKNLPVSGNQQYTITTTNGSVSENDTIIAYELQATSYLIQNDLKISAAIRNDRIDKSENGYPYIRLIYDFGETLPSEIYFKKEGTDEIALRIPIQIGSSATDPLPIEDGTFDVFTQNNTKLTSVTLQLGGVYTLVLVESDSATDGGYLTSIHTITEPNSVHMLWLIPQYVVITMGEVMFSITGLEFSYSQAPTSMKSVLASGWLLTVAFGNLIVIIVAEAKFFTSQAHEFFLFAGLMIADMAIFALMAMRYKYVEPLSQNDDMQMISTQEGEKQGIDNQVFKNDD
ncbi:solute carrier family 15 member 1 isoform X1 [Schistocerca piceifrons]|uniref:solute carrier family 15 member 1 isoform X1 n=1 Tax=Schistocerca piceifrons TaxID=274613 RepID=UPI001F5F97D6|nr:solute carrier family 15 member 1 isoform X1 [Schistocerca piceifrons]